MEITEIVRKSLENFDELDSQICTKNKIVLSGLINEVKPYYITSILYLSKFIQKNKHVLLITPNTQKSDLINKQLTFWNYFFSRNCRLPQVDLNHFYNLKQNIDSKNSQNINTLLGDLTSMVRGVSIIPIGILSEEIVSIDNLTKNTLNLNTEQFISSDRLINKLNKSGYNLEEKALVPGTFSKLGGIINVFPINFKDPIRIEFIGNKIESIKIYDPVINKVKKEENNIKIIPASSPMENNSGNILDYIIKYKPSLILDDPEDFANEIYYESADKLSQFHKATEHLESIEFRPFPTGKKNELTFSYQPPALYKRNLIKFAKDISRYSKENYFISIISAYKSQIQNLLKKKDSVFFIPKNKENLNKIDYISGFINKKIKFILTFDKEILGEKLDIKKRNQIDRLFISELKIGDYVVHIDHGIGKFIGMEQREIDEGLREFLIIEYERGDKLFLPAEYTDKISKYIGQAKPKIHRLHETSWRQIKEKIKHDVKKQAEELLSLYAQREISSGFIFSPDTEHQKFLEDSFEYNETPDQLKAIKEIKKDMEGLKEENVSIEKELSCCKRPMDRLLCGDVGFGKTEIAIRAAFKATQDKKQVAVLCPTTILAQQHYNTFKKRLSGLKCDVGVLSRFKSKKEQQETIKNLSEGKLDVIIGTHRLLSKDIEFKDLGLAIIDEEQRFGVKHKEKLKKMRTDLDIITLSATPIPRTLNLALSNLKNISTLETPPPGRLPVKTIILPKDEKIIKSSIRNELERSGQVYYLHNRVETINAQAKILKKLVPEAKIGIIHGQLPEKVISQVMKDFNNQKINVLICSTIIENGLDMPNANTLIVDNATRFGLADLYQLRGRIGRGKRKGFAYFFYQSQKLKDNAKKRLEALLAAKELGSGFQVAMQDLEIRGAGNILGKEQSGSIKEIGLNLYCRLLNQAIKEIKTGEKEDLVLDVTIDLPVSAFIPKDFINDKKERLNFYQKITYTYNIDDLYQSRVDLINQYGKIPLELDNLYKILEIKILANNIGIKNIDTKIYQKFPDENFFRLSLEFVQSPPYEKIKLLLNKGIMCTLDENILKVDFENSKEEILKFTKDMLNIIK